MCKIHFSFNEKKNLYKLFPLVSSLFLEMISSFIQFSLV